MITAAPPAAEPKWHHLRDDESRAVEERLTAAGFAAVDAYRYNSASIRVRVVDPRFEERSREERDAMVEPILEQLPERIQGDILMLLTLTPEELARQEFDRTWLLRLEFDDPSDPIG